MNPIRIGILGTSEIAFRRFLPALMECDGFSYAGIASRTVEKTVPFVEAFGGVGYPSYEALLSDDTIQAVYLPLPPALHYEWGKKVLEAGKHLLCEKPFTTNLAHTQELIKLAQKKNLAIHENYMFKYHAQIDYIKKLMEDGVVGDTRLIRIAFGFPFRGANDFRYNKELGGGALLDCGGYTVKLATELLGETAKIVASQMNYRDDFDVDIYGSAMAVNEEGLTAQLSFGMDNSYKCEIEVWGSRGTIYTDRILTAPVRFEPTITTKQGNDITTEVIASDDTFGKSIVRFAESIVDETSRAEVYQEIQCQGRLVEEFLGG